MKKEEIKKRKGKGAYEKIKAQNRAWHQVHREKEKAAKKKYREEHPEEMKVQGYKSSRKGGKYYAKALAHKNTGLQGERNIIRSKHRREWLSFKLIIAPDSQIHHEWVPESVNYHGVALVEADQHMHGIIDVIQIIEGEITLLTEDEVKGGSQNVCQAKTKSDC